VFLVLLILEEPSLDRANTAVIPVQGLIRKIVGYQSGHPRILELDSLNGRLFEKRKRIELGEGAV
jgi:hypothetical protein